MKRENKMRYTEKAKLISDLNAGRVAGVILWQGASLIDGEPIVYVATAFAGSDNEKTGAMVQTFVLPDPRAAGIECNGTSPAKIIAWLKSTGARSICGDCPHAWQYNEKTGEFEKGSCYVREYQAPAAVLGAIYRNAYLVAGVDFPAAWIEYLAAGRAVRLGAYGDPAACPAEISAAFVSRAKTRTGYTHGWKSAFPAWRRNAWRMRALVMASCDSAPDYRAAVDAGFRAFYVTPHGVLENGRSALSVGAHVDGAMLCPASSEFEAIILAIAGKRTNCAACGACSGAGGKGERMPNVFIPDHGPKKTKSAACPAAARMLEKMGA